MITLVLVILMHQSPSVAVPTTTPGLADPVVVRMSDADYETLVAQLNSSDWEEREAATLRLARANIAVPVARIEATLQQEGLSLEQVMRLLRVMEIRLLHAARGAIGIQMPLNPAGLPGDLVRVSGVRVSAVIPGLPAEKVLQSGDLITHIDDQPISNREDLARIVQRHWPGDVLRFRVVRTSTIPQEDKGERTRNEQLDLTITLGSTEDLRRSGGTRSVLDPALVERRQRLIALYEQYGAVPSMIPSPAASEPMVIQAESDPVIRGILQQLEASRAGRYPLTPDEIRAQMIQKLGTLDTTLLRKDLTAEQREQLDQRREKLQKLIDSTDPRQRW